MWSLAEPGVCSITKIHTSIHPKQFNEHLVNKHVDRRVPCDHGQFAFPIAAVYWPKASFQWGLCADVGIPLILAASSLRAASTTVCCVLNLYVEEG